MPCIDMQPLWSELTLILNKPDWGGRVNQKSRKPLILQHVVRGDCLYIVCLSKRVEAVLRITNPVGVPVRERAGPEK